MKTRLPPPNEKTHAFDGNRDDCFNPVPKRVKKPSFGQIHRLAELTCYLFEVV